MFDSDFYDLTQNTAGAIFGAAIKLRASKTVEALEAPPALLQLRGGLAESPGWMLVQAIEFDPEPINVEKLRQRAVWSSPEIIGAILELLHTEKWLTRHANGDYSLTAAGRATWQHRLELRYDLMSYLDEAVPNIDRLLVLLHKVIDLSLAGETDTWCLRYSRNRASNDAPRLYQIVQFTSDLNAYRDDCHMASFMPHHIEPYAFESFSFIWGDQANSPESVYDQIAYRGWSLAQFEQGFADLVKRGWIAASGDNQYTATDAGQAVRREIEAETDRRFYAPWEKLGEGEAEEIQQLLQGLHDQCVELGM